MPQIDHMLPRHARSLVADALADTRVVFIAGARQVGKSTLAHQVVEALAPHGAVPHDAAPHGAVPHDAAPHGAVPHDAPPHDAVPHNAASHDTAPHDPASHDAVPHAAAPNDARVMELNLDDRYTREAALADPEGLIAGLQGRVVIDEVQRAPDLLLAIKAAVDRDTTPGRFLVTGSANVRTARKVKDALTGRMETVRLWPLAQSEIHDSSANLVDALFACEPPHLTGSPAGREAFVEVVAAGGYPEALARTGRRRSRWFANYIDTTLDRDLREISDARKLAEMPRLLRLLAAQAANVLSYRSLAAKLDLTHDTVREYVGLLQTIFLVHLLPAWRPGIGAREAHAPKAYMVDSGLLAHLLGADERRIAADDQVTGKTLENFVVTEILKHASWSQVDATAYHYRQRAEEIDLVLESRAGELVAIEVKAATSTARSDLKPMERLRDRLGDRFKAGVILCSTPQTTPLGDRLWALPIAALWTG